MEEGKVAFIGWMNLTRVSGYAFGEWCLRIFWMISLVEEPLTKGRAMV
jgi:hypothetical protein